VETEGTGDNERLEFLGDAVLGLVVAEALFLLHPSGRRAELTRVRSQLVSRQQSGEVAAVIGLAAICASAGGEEQGRSQAQEHRALQHHGGCFGRAVLAWWTGAGYTACPAAG